MATRVVENRKSPGCLVQLLWFAFVGWWLGQAWMVVAWVLMVTIIGIPFGIAMINLLPKVIALREPDEKLRVSSYADGSVVTAHLENRQAPFLMRAIYFILIGWWITAVWMEAAYAISMTVIGLPIGFWMFDRVPGLLTLRR
jgi:uncharacterized membrane protein YccF (DUF307 family)